MYAQTPWIKEFQVLSFAATCMLQSDNFSQICWDGVYGMYLPCFLCNQGKRRGLISGRWGHVFPELLSIMSKHTSFCRHFICSQSPHQGLALSSKQWAQESTSLLYKKSGSHLDSCISLSRHTRHVSGITCWNNAVLIAILVTLSKTTNTKQRREFQHCLRGFGG